MKTGAPPLLQHLSHHEIQRVRDSLDRICPPATVTSPGELSDEQQRSELAWRAARRSVINDLDIAIVQAKARAKKELKT